MVQSTLKDNYINFMINRDKMKKDSDSLKPVKKRLMTIRELSTMIGYSPGTIYNLIARNALPFPFVRVSSRKIMVDILDVEKWIQESKVKPETEEEEDDFIL